MWNLKCNTNELIYKTEIDSQRKLRGKEGRDKFGIQDYQVHAAAAKSLQSCLNLCNPIESSPPGSPVPGILKARTLEWVAIPFSNA